MQSPAVFLPKLRVALCIALLGSPVLVAGARAADEAPGSASAQFRLGEEVYELGHAVAFRTSALKSRPGKEVVVVVLTRDVIDEAVVAEAVRSTGNWTGSGHVRLILRFQADGKLFWGMFQGDAKNLQLEEGKISATVEVGATGVKGTLSQEESSDFLGTEYVLEGARFDVAFLETLGGT